MAGNSTTRSFLLPINGAPEGQELNRFLQQWVVGMTGLDGTMVRPRWQAQPASIPDAGEAWASIGTTTTDSDTSPYVGHDPSGDGSDQLQKHETFTLLSSFYDLGTNGLADFYASLLRDGCAIEQNREMLLPIKIIDIGQMVNVPSLLKQRWLYRVDLPLTLRRQIDRTYPVFNLRSSEGLLTTDDGITRNITVEPPP